MLPWKRLSVAKSAAGNEVCSGRHPCSCAATTASDSRRCGRSFPKSGRRYARSRPRAPGRHIRLLRARMRDQKAGVKRVAAPNQIVFTGTDPNDETSLLDILDHVLNAGVILRGNLVISLAGVDLIYVGLDVILTSVETAMQHMQKSALPPPRKR